MKLNYNKLFNSDSIKKEKDVNEIDKTIEYEELLYAISEFIINYRKEKRITQKKLATILNVNQTMISKLESGAYNPSFKQIYNISWKLSNSSDLFLKILKNIEEKIKRITSQEYQTQFTFNENTNYYINKSINSNVINLTYKNKIGGIIDNGECTSSISNAG